MNTKRRIFTALGAVSVVAASTIVAVGVSASDHLDAPAVRTDGRTDLNDLYVFQSPTNSDNTVLIMTVNPGAGVISGTTLHPDAKYRFNIDDDGDALADSTIDVTFDKVGRNGKQKAKVDLKGAAGRARGEGTVGKDFKIGRSGRATVGLFDDPFFFDLDGFKDAFNFTGVDFFAGLNTTAIVVEVPSRLLGNGGIGVWVTTSLMNSPIDQIGRPAINTALIDSARKDAFNVTPPSQQLALFGAEVEARILVLNGGNAAHAEAVTAILIPDTLTFEIGNAGAFLNGRQPANDVIDAELSVLTDGALTTDGVGANDVPLPNTFPYLAPAH